MSPAPDRILTRRFALIAALGLMAAILVLSLLPQQDLPSTGTSDKWNHFAAYAALAVPVAVYAGPGRAWQAWAFTSAYGFLVEVAQALSPTGREFSLADEAANMGGAAIGVLAVLVLNRMLKD